MSAESSRKILLTGATGFIGTALLEQLAGAAIDSVVCLARRPEGMRFPLQAGAVQFTALKGDLADPDSYLDALRDVDTVVHLAAATGSASVEQLNRINVEGTRKLLEACRARQVRRFVFISSIAAIYPDLRDYPYGRTKRDAEELVRRSGISYAILRPTIVLGAGSANAGMLYKLANLPIVPLFNGGTVLVQPVDVTDVARSIVAVLKQPPSDAIEIEVGGPEAVTFADFMQRLRQAGGRPKAPAITIPVWPIRTGLKLAQLVFRGRFPVSPGQLSPFVYDGKARSSELMSQLRPLTPLATLLEQVALQESSPTAHEPDAQWMRECVTFTLYLSGRRPDAYVLRKYGEAQATVIAGVPITAIDRMLLRFAAGGTFRARIGDAYARIFRPYGVLRRKLILMLAILENSEGFHKLFTSGSQVSPPGAVPRIGVAVAMFCVALSLGVLVFGPRHLLGGAKPEVDQ